MVLKGKYSGVNCCPVAATDMVSEATKAQRQVVAKLRMVKLSPETTCVSDEVL
jgi:hypothetical protein